MNFAYCDQVFNKSCQTLWSKNWVILYRLSNETTLIQGMPGSRTTGIQDSGGRKA